MENLISSKIIEIYMSGLFTVFFNINAVKASFDINNLIDTLRFKGDPKVI